MHRTISQQTEALGMAMRRIASYRIVSHRITAWSCIASHPRRTARAACCRAHRWVPNGGAIWGPNGGGHMGAEWRGSYGGRMGAEWGSP